MSFNMFVNYNHKVEKFLLLVQITIIKLKSFFFKFKLRWKSHKDLPVPEAAERKCEDPS